MVKLFKNFFPKNFFPTIAGAVTAGVVEGTMTYFAPEIFGQPHREPDLNPPLVAEPLLPMEQWVGIVTIPLIGYIATQATKKEKVRAFGDGLITYALPRFVSREVVRTEAASRRNWAPP